MTTTVHQTEERTQASGQNQSADLNAAETTQITKKPTQFLSPRLAGQLTAFPTSTQPASPDQSTVDITVSLEPRPVTGLRKWEGRIIEIDDDLFSAELVPLDHKGPVVVADFALDLLATVDDNVGEGDVFYLTTRVVGQAYKKEVTSSLKPRRLGRWSESDLADAKEKARQLHEALDQHAI